MDLSPRTLFPLSSLAMMRFEPATGDSPMRLSTILTDGNTPLYTIALIPPKSITLTTDRSIT
jgi:hypothetical protein